MTEEYKCFAWKILQVLFFNKKDIKASEKGVGGLSTRITAPSFVIHLRIRPDLRKNFSWQNSSQDSIFKRGQGTFNCGILVAGVGGSGDPRRKWEEMGEHERRERQREDHLEKCGFYLQNDLKEP